MNKIHANNISNTKLLMTLFFMLFFPVTLFIFSIILLVQQSFMPGVTTGAIIHLLPTLVLLISAWGIVKGIRSLKILGLVVQIFYSLMLFSLQLFLALSTNAGSVSMTWVVLSITALINLIGVFLTFSILKKK